MAKAPDTWSGFLDVDDPADGPLMDISLDGLKASSDSVDGTQILAGAGITTKALDTGAILHNAGASNLRRVLYGIKSVVVQNGNAESTADVTIAFSTDAIEGSAVFASATGLIVVLTPLQAAGAPTNEFINVHITVAPTATDVKIRGYCTKGTNVTADRTVTVHWYAIGRI